LLKSLKGLLAIMGLKSVNELKKEQLFFVDKDLKVYEDIDVVFEEILNLKN
jgi:isopentenyl diphosphate isomerase/L-lactate dehydrogenase-like FMN-dependent dehydrogenase